MLQIPFRQKLIDAAQNDTLREEVLRNNDRVITNRRGGFLSRIREELYEFRNKLATTEQKLDSTTAKLAATSAELTTKTKALFAKTDELERTTIGFQDFHNRFISTFKRNILQNIDASN